MTGPNNKCIAYFISPHGYGHAARASAVMEAVHEIDSTVSFEIFTRVPRWFFENSISGKFGYHRLLTDIGLVQKSPLDADISETIRRLDQFLPLDRTLIKNLVPLIKGMKCRLILCDIAPMGIKVAEESGIPSVLIENFTWDWIYEGYVSVDERIKKHIQYLKRLFNAAVFRVQTEPVCLPRSADLTVNPVSRRARTPVTEIREELDIPEDGKMVIITMGGIPQQYAFLKHLSIMRDIHFIVPGAVQQMETYGNLVLLPHRSQFFHPDLVNASDGIIGKVGYSTLAEVYYTGLPFGYIPRKKFRESRVLVSFIEKQMRGIPILENEFNDGDWLSNLPDLLTMPRELPQCQHGSKQLANFISSLINAMDLK